uniref:Pep3/Vps18 beta-propeller domain-containing protein n=1 Tax=Ananas comosus var. bracteatus TaxID=296719 RepID=A0A6V7NW93_ANACO|nr:unnamed protein product [Ananas comosus var. bracteatus]
MVIGGGDVGRGGGDRGSFKKKTLVQYRSLGLINITRDTTRRLIPLSSSSFGAILFPRSPPGVNSEFKAMDAVGRRLFSVDPLERHAAKGHGVITSMSAGNDVILLGTSKGWLIRHDFGLGDTQDLDLGGGRSGDQAVHRVFVDPGAATASPRSFTPPAPRLTTCTPNGRGRSFLVASKASSSMPLLGIAS